LSDIFEINNEKKNEYLESIKQTNEPATYELYRKLIYKLDEFENYKGVLATNMTKIDFLEFLTSLNSTSLGVLYTYKSAISSYLLYITDTQKFTIGILELRKITQEDLVECVNQIMEASQFITEKEYYELLNSEKGNWQDKLVLVLLWNKIKGTTFRDILNLKKEDVNLENRTIQVENRIINFTEKEIEVVKKAIKEQVYKITTMKKRGITSHSEIDYAVGEYLIKSTMGTRNKELLETNQCQYGSFANRMSKYYNIVLERAELTNTRIYKSSIYYYMLKEYGRKLNLNEITEYTEKHNVTLSLSNFYREQDVMWNKIAKEDDKFGMAERDL